MHAEAPDERAAMGRTAGWLWLFMALVMLVGVVLPTAGVVHERLGIAAAGYATLYGVASLTGLFPWERMPMWQHRVAILLTAPMVAILQWITGGADSYALPLLSLPVFFAAFFYSWRWVTGIVVIFLVALAAPLVYDPRAFEEGYLPAYATVAITCVVLSGVTVWLKGRLATSELVQREMAMTDPLTGAANRRAFDLALGRELRHGGADEAGATAVLLFDLDHFKQINDIYGHPAGDRVLRGVASRCAQVLRPQDRLCRIGGDEFAVVAPRAGAAGAARLAQGLRERVAIGGEGEPAASVTVVWALLGPDGRDYHELMRAVDQRLHAVKDARAGAAGGSRPTAGPVRWPGASPA